MRIGGLRPVLDMLIRYILPNTDSIGFNEQELGMLMHAPGAPDPVPLDLSSTLPVEHVRDCIAFARATGVPRVHLHTFGYYILILKSGLVQPELSRNALLLAARSTADAAGGDAPVLSPEGLLAYADVREAFGPVDTPGIFNTGDRVVVFIPTWISHHIHKTTGLGDILSSTAFVADPF